MSYQVELAPPARRQLKKLPSDIQSEILQALTDLEADPRPMGVLKMSGADTYRIRIRNYRVVYEIYDEVLIVIVVRIGHRRDVYR